VLEIEPHGVLVRRDVVVGRVRLVRIEYAARCGQCDRQPVGQLRRVVDERGEAAGVGFQMSTAFALLLLGLLLSYVVLVASSVRVWALAARPDSKTPVVADPVGNGATP
jgi:hypothetical protein